MLSVSPNICANGRLVQVGRVSEHTHEVSFHAVSGLWLPALRKPGRLSWPKTGGGSSGLLRLPEASPARTSVSRKRSGLSGTESWDEWRTGIQTKDPPFALGQGQSQPSSASFSFGEVERCGAGSVPQVRPGHGHTPAVCSESPSNVLTLGIPSS